jgi:hypothetical protein
MSEMRGLPLGVCVFAEAGPNAARTVSYPRYVNEILAHAGVFYQSIAPAELDAKLPQLRVLVTVGESTLPEATKKKLADWVNAGGAWLSVGGLCGMDELIGASRVAVSYKNWGGGTRSLGEGYLVADEQQAKHLMLAHLNRPLHFFGGAAVETKGATVLATAQDAHGRPRKRSEPALMERTVGKGSRRFHRAGSDRHGRIHPAGPWRDHARRRSGAGRHVAGQRFGAQER